MLSDTPHAVLAHAVRAAERLTAEAIHVRLFKLPPGPGWVVLSGGNPLLHDLGDLVRMLKTAGLQIAVETQATRWKDWILECDSICLSPKPPSAQMSMQKTETLLAEFLANLNGHDAYLKVVIFDNADYAWAQEIHKQYPYWPFYLSAGNDAGKTVGNPDRQDDRSQDQIVTDLLAKYRWLVNKVMVDPTMRDARVQAQAHVLIWGNEKGR